MEKFEPVKSLKDLYTASREVKEVVAERGVFLCVDGTGDPGDEVLKQAGEQLHTVAGKTRTLFKESGRLDFKTSRLELRWISDPLMKSRSEELRWSLLLRVPDEVTPADLREARRALLAEKGYNASAVKRISWREGRALQVLQVGLTEQKDDIYKKLRERADELGYRVRGPLHEIYINNPRRIAPDKIKKIMRLPIAWPRPEYAQGPSPKQTAGQQPK